MTQEQAITPPPELALQWFLEAKAMPVDQWVIDVATQAARWGSDQELEECCGWLSDELAVYLRAKRRPNEPPSRKQRALDALVQLEEQHLSAELAAEIRNALEALPDD
jgi:hypothetical protein